MGLDVRYQILKVDGKIMRDFDTLFANQVYNGKEVILTVKKNTS